MFSAILTDVDHSDAVQPDTSTFRHDIGSADAMPTNVAEAERHVNHDEQPRDDSPASVPANSGHHDDSSAEDVVEHALETPPFRKHDDANSADDSASAAVEADVPNDADSDTLNHPQVHADGSRSSEHVESSSTADGADLNQVPATEGAFVLLDAVSTNSGING